jgi:uncharacterized protein involved in exopolysaccharide biosynthesis
MTLPPVTESPKRELLVFYYKYRLRLWLAFLLPFLAAVALSFVPTPRYAAESTLVVRLGSEYVYQPDAGASTAGQPSPIPFDRDQIYKAEVAILGSYDLHELVVREVGVDRMYPSSGETPKQGTGAAIKKTIVALLDKWFPDDADESLMGRMASGVRVALIGDDLDVAVTPAERERKRIERAVMVFEKRLKITLERESAVIALSFQHKDRAVAIEALDELLKQYMEKRKALYTETRTAPARQQLDNIKRRAAGAQSAVERFKREHKIYSLPDQRMQLLQQREDIRKQMGVVSNPSLEEKYNNVMTQLDALDAQERRFYALEHESQVANEEYSVYVRKLDEAQAYDSIERARAGSVRVIQPPAAAPEPKKLQGIIVDIGFVLSLMFTALVAAVTEFSRSGFLTPERLERNVGLPVLTAVPWRK